MHPTGGESPPPNDSTLTSIALPCLSFRSVLEQGTLAKVVLDAAVDACSGMQNLREAIGSYRARFLKETRERQRNTLMNVCLVRVGAVPSSCYFACSGKAAYRLMPMHHPSSNHLQCQSPALWISGICGVGQLHDCPRGQAGFLTAANTK